MTKPRWTARDLPDLHGKTAVVTGANSGLGFETARALAGAGAHVVLACRNQDAAADALSRIRGEHASASLEVAALDLASLASIRAFAASVAEKHPRLDLLINNAGVMALPPRKTADGFEMQLGTNHLGHFALTALLLPQVLRAAPARVVTVSSGVHLVGAMRWDDLQWTRGYARWRVYAQSKLANLLFAYELDRRLRARGLDVKSLACHPGYAATNLQAVGPRMSGSSLGERFMAIGNALFAQSAAMGALPTLYAAAAPEAQGSDYVGPGGLFNLWGYPKRQKSSRRSRDEAAARRLWDVSVELTGASFEGIG
jgi:NAD(P)-dependent dehydrogenase (short-subunit alcohol dehydrogenase family)